MSNSWKSLDLRLIYGEVELDLRWSKECTISEISRASRLAGNYLKWEVTATRTSATCQTNNTKLYVSIIAFSVNGNNKFLKIIKQGFKRTISYNKYRSDLKTQPKSTNLDYLIDPTFRNVNRLLVFSFKNDNDDPTRNSFDQYYMPLVERF